MWVTNAVWMHERSRFMSLLAKSGGPATTCRLVAAGKSIDQAPGGGRNLGKGMYERQAEKKKEKMGRTSAVIETQWETAAERSKTVLKEREEKNIRDPHVERV